MPTLRVMMELKRRFDASRLKGVPKRRKIKKKARRRVGPVEESPSGKKYPGQREI